MSNLGAVRDSWLEAWRFRWPLTVAHLANRMVLVAIITPLAAGVLRLGIGLSDQTALTDQDIALLLLSPLGLACALLVASVVIVGAVLNVAVMTGVIHSGRESALSALRAGLGRVVARAPSLFGFAVRLLLRVLVIAAPFVLAGLLVARHYLTEFDINYYLSQRPPEFVTAVWIIGGILLILAVLLGRALIGWAVSLHLILFQDRPSRAVFGESTSLMTGHRGTLALRVVIWLVMRLAIGFAVAGLFGFAAAAIVPRIGSDLRLAAVALIALLLFWGLVDALVTALATGALSSLLYRLFLAVSGVTVPVDAAVTKPRERRPLPVAAMLFGLAALVVVGLVAGGRILASVRTTDQVEVIAHRGGGAGRPENTMAAIRQGIEDGADWIEIDVQETVDGELVVFHDSDFMRLAQVDRKIWEVTAAELQEIDLGSWFDPAYADERAPSLRDVLTTAKGRAKVMIELKYYGHDQNLEARVTDMVDEFDMTDQVALMSLSYPAVQKVRAMRPDLRTGVLAATAVGNLAGLETDFLAVNLGLVTPNLIRSAHAAGKDVYAWTVDDPITMSRMISQGLDGLITDEPAVARQVLAYRAELSTPERLLLSLLDRFGLKPEPEVVRDGSA
jgi:glycerophosphoryl diester phosphodiesterase